MNLSIKVVVLMHEKWKVINDQHEELFYLLQHVVSISDRRRFFDKFVEHVQFEEQFMRDIGFPDYEVHTSRHHYIIERLKSICEDKHGNFDYIESWRYHHTQVTDTHILTWLEDSNIPDTSYKP